MQKSNVYPLKRDQATKRTCSFSAVSDKGNVVHGTAAFLVVAKRNGGIDNYIKKIAGDAAEVALNSAVRAGKKSA